MKQLNDARLNMRGGWFQRFDVGRVGNKVRILNRILTSESTQPDFGFLKNIFFA